MGRVWCHTDIPANLILVAGNETFGGVVRTPQGWIAYTTGWPKVINGWHKSEEEAMQWVEESFLND